MPGPAAIVADTSAASETARHRDLHHRSRDFSTIQEELTQPLSTSIYPLDGWKHGDAMGEFQVTPMSEERLQYYRYGQEIPKVVAVSNVRDRLTGSTEYYMNPTE